MEEIEIMKKVLVAGATGYLGNYITKELIKKDIYTKVVVRNVAKFEKLNLHVNEIINEEVTKYSSLKNCCKDVDVIISSIGITRQKDGLTYMDVDYQANKNLLEKAKENNVKKFIYVSVLNGDKFRNIQICEAKEKFVNELKNSGIDYCIIRPNGFFSDMTEFYNMAIKGRIYLFGDGTLKSNPIHGEDLAKVCVDAIESNEKEIEVGGPEILTQNEIAKISFDATHKKPKITYIPNWIRKLVLKISKLFLSKSAFGPIEFFMTVMAEEMIAPKYGNYTLSQYFNELSKK